MALINRLDAAAQSAEGDNAIRIQVAEHTRLVAQYRVSEILERLEAVRPDRAQCLRESLRPWFYPALLVVFLVGVDQPTLAARIHRAENQRGAVTKVIDVWRAARNGIPDKTVIAVLSELFEAVGLRCAVGSFGTQYRRQHPPDKRNSEIERADLWTRLGVILEEVGYCEEGTAIERELEGHWRYLGQPSPAPTRARR